jgi:hypothetical protein
VDRRVRRLTAVGALLAGVLATGCSAPVGPPDANRPGRTWTAAPIVIKPGSLIAARLPQVAYRGGPYLSNPRLVTITFPGDPSATALERFGQVLPSSRWWREAVEAYCTPTGDCIGDGRPAEPVRLAERPPAQVHAAEIVGLLARRARADDLGPIDDQTLLLAYLPPGIVMVDERGTPYCAGGPRAVHSAFPWGPRRIPYAVIPRCSDESETTATASHEILEATTNPNPAQPGFAFDPAGPELAFTTAGVEPVDPCGLITSDTHRAVESGFTVQRAWSNRAAARGHHPCGPGPTDRPYLALIPDRPTVRLPDIGATTTITLTAAADCPVDRWEITALDLTATHDGGHYLETTLDRGTVTPGDTATLTLTVRALHPSRQTVVALLSTRDGQTDLWPLAVIQR